MFTEECLISNDPGKYHYVAQGMLTIDNVDDAEEMRITDEAFDVLGFNKVSFEIFMRYGIENIICKMLGGKIKYVQMYSSYYAFW
jgi:myosin heavy subunit